MKSLVIFDLDGTLVNTIEDLANATDHALTELGFPTHAVPSYRNMVGNGVTKLLERALPEEARSTRMIQAMRTHFRVIDRANVVLQCRYCECTVPHDEITIK